MIPWLITTSTIRLTQLVISQPFCHCNPDINRQKRVREKCLSRCLLSFTFAAPVQHAHVDKEAVEAAQGSKGHTLHAPGNHPLLNYLSISKLVPEDAGLTRRPADQVLYEQLQQAHPTYRLRGSLQSRYPLLGDLLHILQFLRQCGAGGWIVNAPLGLKLVAHPAIECRGVGLYIFEKGIRRVKLVDGIRSSHIQSAAQSIILNSLPYRALGLKKRFINH